MKRTLCSGGNETSVGIVFLPRQVCSACGTCGNTCRRRGRNERTPIMWKTAALTIFAATILAGSIHESASAQGYGYGYGDTCQRNGNLNPGMPPDWVHDPVTQKWLAPNTREAAIACQRQAGVNAQAYGTYTSPPNGRHAYNRYGYGNPYG